jgi:hypothetical protein
VVSIGEWGTSLGYFRRNGRALSRYRMWNATMTMTMIMSASAARTQLW